MQEFKTITDALDFAIQEEQNAVDFYTKLAASSRNQQMKKAFLDFANEERGHKAKLQTIKSGRAGSLGLAKGSFDMKLSDYLVDVKPSDDMSYQDALILAMKKEKAAFKLYSDLAMTVDDAKLRKVFQDLAQEEAGHKMRFEVEYDDMILTDN